MYYTYKYFDYSYVFNIYEQVQQLFLPFSQLQHCALSNHLPVTEAPHP